MQFADARVRDVPRASVGEHRGSEGSEDMMTKFVQLAALAATISATGCIPDHDYEGDYAMTYDIVLELDGPAARVEALAGLAAVEIREGFHDDYYVDLGASFCRLAATKTQAADVYSEVPWLAIAPQACWFAYGDRALPLSISGTATFHADTELVTIDLAGTYTDDKTGGRGAVTVKLSERWD